jgi:protein-glucosylgalactosylhydroxylysine glucosidase
MIKIFMMKSIPLFILVVLYSSCLNAQSINRKKIFDRHKINVCCLDSLNALSIGNGNMAMTVDITGLQTFPKAYKNGVSLGTQATWSWHSFPNTENYTIEETLDTLLSNGKKVAYAKQWSSNSRAGKAANFLRLNPHRIHLGQLGLVYTTKDGRELTPQDLSKMKQTLDMWTGVITSKYMIDGESVTVETLMNQENDLIALQIKSKLLKTGRLGLKLIYPYPTSDWLDEAAFYNDDESTRLKQVNATPQNLSIERKLDDLTYYTLIQSEKANCQYQNMTHGYKILPQTQSDTWSVSCLYSLKNEPLFRPFETIKKESMLSMATFWNKGGIIDFANVTHPYGKILEDRMVKSLYLTKVNCSGAFPPQETGLTYNSWFGKPHMEMIWWHSTPFAQWGHPDILEKQLDWYFTAYNGAKKIAERQGYKGVRWQKMTDHHGGETSSSVGSYLIWQQPHVIYLVDLLHRIQGSKFDLKKYIPLINGTAEFMADFAYFDPTSKKYKLGPGVIAAQERFDPKYTYNPTFEVEYWKWALAKAQKMNAQLNLPTYDKWQHVIDHLPNPIVKDGLYLGAETAPDSYTNQNLLTDHPSVMGIYGMLPAQKGFDNKIFLNTMNKIDSVWHWSDTWGWDFPMMAMSATRLGLDHKAMMYLMKPITTNTYLNNGHNYQNGRLRLYLPGNGGLLMALGMIAKGTLDNPKTNRDLPKEWKIKSEGLYFLE